MVAYAGCLGYENGKYIQLGHMDICTYISIKLGGLCMQEDSKKPECTSYFKSGDDEEQAKREFNQKWIKIINWLIKNQEK